MGQMRRHSISVGRERSRNPDGALHTWIRTSRSRVGLLWAHIEGVWYPGVWWHLKKVTRVTRAE